MRLSLELQETQHQSLIQRNNWAGVILLRKIADEILVILFFRPKFTSARWYMYIYIYNLKYRLWADMIGMPPWLHCYLVFIELIGLSKDLAVQNCKVLKKKSPYAVSGVYWIDPNGGSRCNAFQAFYFPSVFFILHANTVRDVFIVFSLSNLSLQDCPKNSQCWIVRIWNRNFLQLNQVSIG